VIYLLSTDIDESSDFQAFIKFQNKKNILDLNDFETSIEVSLELENSIVERLISSCSSKRTNSNELFPYISNLYQNSVFPNMQLLVALSKMRTKNSCISLPYKYILKPKKSFYAMAKGESQATFLVDSYQYYYHVIHQWAESNSLKIKYRNHIRSVLIDNCLKPIIRLLALNIKVFVHLYSYMIKSIRFNGLFRLIGSSRRLDEFIFSGDLPSKVFLVRTANHLKFFSNVFSSTGQYCTYLETSLTDSFGVFNTNRIDNAVHSLLFSSPWFILRLLILQVSLLFRKNFYFSAFSFQENVVKVRLSDDISLSLEDALFEVQQMYLELVLFKQNFSNFLAFRKNFRPAFSEILSFECRSPHSFVISSLSRSYNCHYVQYQPCLFANSPLSIFPNSDSLFIGKFECVDKFKSFYNSRKHPQIFQHKMRLVGTTYRYNRSSPPVIFSHPRNPEINNLLLSCDFDNSAFIKFHPRQNSFLARSDLYRVYKSRIFPKNCDTIQLSIALTYCSASILEFINCRIPFVCISTSRDYSHQPFFSASYIGFCSSVDEALNILNNPKNILDSFVNSYYSN